jgi:hypothetical protein
MFYLNQPPTPTPTGVQNASVHTEDLAVPESGVPQPTTIGAESTILHLSFRHSFWGKRRHRTDTALSALLPNSSRLHRFRLCGQDTWVMQSSQNPSKFRLRTNACKDRFCEACAIERRRRIARNVVANLPETRLLFVTLTLRSRPGTLRSQLDRILKCFHKLRNRSKMKPFFPGGLYFLEVTRNRQSGLWHPHVHILVEKSFIPHGLLKSIWHAITEDSFIVDIKQVRSVSHVAGYITKYAAKSIPSDVWNDPAALSDAMVAFAGKRTFSTFGTWKDFDLSKKPDDDEGWVDVAPLSTILRQARAGSRHAAEILSHLRKRPDHDPKIDDSS